MSVRRIEENVFHSSVRRLKSSRAEDRQTFASDLNELTVRHILKVNVIRLSVGTLMRKNGPAGRGGCSTLIKKQGTMYGTYQHRTSPNHEIRKSVIRTMKVNTRAGCNHLQQARASAPRRPTTPSLIVTVNYCL